jgi:hypothetical protein
VCLDEDKAMNGEPVITRNRRRVTRLGLALAGAVAAIALAAVAVTAAPIRGLAKDGQTSELAIPMPPSGVLRILNAGGRIIVNAWDRDEVLLTITREVVTRGSSAAFLGLGAGSAIDDATRAALEAFEPSLKHSSDAIEVTTLSRPPSDDVIVNYNYEVRMPRGSTLAVSNGSGPVSVSGVQGGVNVATGNGDVRFDAVAGDLIARAENGAMSFSNAAGPLDAETANGAILVDNRMLSAIHPVNCRTNNGPIRLRAPQAGAYDVNATTLNGVVEAAAADGSAPATLHTLNGSIVVDGI